MIKELINSRRLKAFSSKIAKSEIGACWGWKGFHTKHGYAGFSINEKPKVYSMTAHRIAYFLFFGEIPHLTIDHLCRNRGCVNPYHLMAKTNRQNILAGECEAAQNARKTHCKRGHLLSGQNLLIVGSEKIRRTCRACAKIHKDAWDSRNR